MSITKLSNRIKQKIFLRIQRIIPTFLSSVHICRLMAKEVVLVPKEKYQKLLENQERMSNSEFEKKDLNFISKYEKKTTTVN